MTGKRRVAAAPLVVLLATFVFGVTPACAQAPWWGVTSGTRPSSLHAGVAQNEVQELKVNAVGGDVLWAVASNPFGEHVVFPYNASHEEVQAALEGLYGKDNVEVAGGCKEEVPPLSECAYKVTFKNALVGQPVPPPAGEDFGFAGFFGSPSLEGEASIAEVAKGRPDGSIVVTVQNRGDSSTTGPPVQILDTLPKGLQLAGVEGVTGVGLNGVLSHESISCERRSSGTQASCESSTPLAPYEAIELHIGVVVEPEARTGAVNTVSVSGGAASGATVPAPVSIGEEEGFGFEDYELIPENEGGTVDTQAGSHPFQLTTVLTLNQTAEHVNANGHAEAPPLGFAKHIETRWPAGLIGNPTPLAQCTDVQFSTPGSGGIGNSCAPETAVGVAVVTLNDPGDAGVQTFDVPLFNLTPNAGEPARFGFMVFEVPTYLDTSVRTGGDYGVTVSSNAITQLIGFLGLKVTVWGVPGSPLHDGQRGWACLEGRTTSCSLGQRPTPPFLVMPTSCEPPFTASVHGESWPTAGPDGQRLAGVTAEPLSYTLRGGLGEPLSIDGCNKLQFSPEISVSPDVPDASTATGLTVGVHVPQQGSIAPNGLAESALRDTTVVLPEGVGVNPGGADGLEACSESQVGFLGKQVGEPDVNLFTPGVPNPFCPGASKVGTVEIESPLLPHALKGAVYLAAQNQNPFGSLLAMYLVAEDPVSGYLVKLAGEVTLDPSTGRLTTTFKETPEAPFEDLRLHFFGGSRAPLGTPALCGSYTTQASFTPWSGDEPASPTSTFTITSGPNGGPCQSPLPFAPSLTASSSSVQAGGFTPFSLTMSRSDGNQDLQAVQVHLPRGLSGLLSGVKLCGEAEANAGTCGPESLLGHTIVSVGLGGNPYTVTGGQVFLTGPYQGAPFGLSIVNPAKAGPFDLGNVVVRAKIEVDPHTAQLTSPPTRQDRMRSRTSSTGSPSRSSTSTSRWTGPRSRSTPPTATPHRSRARSAAPKARPRQCPCPSR
jgi:hypothetical protein